MGIKERRTKILLAFFLLSDVNFDAVVIDEKVEKIFDLRPAAIIDRFQLTKPKGWSYRDTAAYGHFGREIFPWEKLDKVSELKRAFK